MAETTNYDKVLYDRSVNTLLTHGIISIVCGALGLAGSLLLLGMAMFMPGFPDGHDTTISDKLSELAAGIIFLIIPFTYFIVAGAYLRRTPAPNVAKTLVIINLIIGVVWCFIVSIFAIITLAEFSNYKRGYDEYQKKIPE